MNGDTILWILGSLLAYNVVLLILAKDWNTRFGLVCRTAVMWSLCLIILGITHESQGLYLLVGLITVLSISTIANHMYVTNNRGKRNWQGDIIRRV